MNFNAHPYEPLVQPSKSPVNVPMKKNSFKPTERAVDLSLLYNFLINNSSWHNNNANYIMSFGKYINNNYNFRKYCDEVEFHHRSVRMNLFFVDAIIDYIKKQIVKKNTLNNLEENTTGLFFSEIEDIINIVNVKKVQTQNIMVKVNDILRKVKY